MHRDPGRPRRSSPASSSGAGGHAPRTAPGAPGPAFELTIDDVAFGGKAVGRHEGKVCFVAGALPGERVRAQPGRERGAFTEADLMEVLSASPDRILPVCPLALHPPASNLPSGGAGGPRPTGASLSPSHLPPDNCHLPCPGCAYQHVTHAAELAFKQHQLASLLERHAGVPGTVCQPPVAAPAPLGYRNKMVLHAQVDGRDVRLGYYAADNTTILDVPACPLALAPLNACLAERRADAAFWRSLRDDLPVTFRWTPRGGALWWRGRASDQDVWLVEDSVIGPLAVPRNSFYQMNPVMADRLVAHVRDRITALQPAAAIDLFCGIGVFALAAAKAGVPRVIGVDVDGPGIHAAEYNARQHGLEAAITWRSGKAEEALGERMAGVPWTETLMLVDPPRSGLGRGLIRTLARQRPGRLLYVSCAADTMTRDATWLQEAGYRVESSQLFDMFPRTAHFESVTEFVLR